MDSSNLTSATPVPPAQELPPTPVSVPAAAPTAVAAPATPSPAPTAAGFPKPAGGKGRKARQPKKF